MKGFRHLIFGPCALMLILAGCGQEAGEPTATTPEATGPASETVAAGEDLDSLLANADLDRGKTLFLQCRACHSLESAEPHKVGPNLHGMFGRQAGEAEGFAYSPALLESDVVWSPETLDAWMARPSEFLPGNRMVFIGVKKPADRAHLIAYLQEATAAQ